MLSRAARSTSRTLVPALGSLGSRQKHSLPDLPYDYGALEPHINAQIMQLHHSKHHATYVNNLNAIEEKYLEALEKGDITAQVALQPGLKFNGGGHINHSIFWTNLSPKGGGEPKERQPAREGTQAGGAGEEEAGSQWRSPMRGSIPEPRDHTVS